MIMKGFVAILAGLAVTMAIVVVFTWTAAVLMGVMANEPTPAYLIVNLIINAVAALSGGYLAGRIAYASPLLYASILGAILFLLGLPMILSGPLLGQPDWYPVTTALTGLLGAIAGGAGARFTSPGRATTGRDEA